MQRISITLLQDAGYLFVIGLASAFYNAADQTVGWNAKGASGLIALGISGAVALVLGLMAGKGKEWAAWGGLVLSFVLLAYTGITAFKTARGSFRRGPRRPPVVQGRAVRDHRCFFHQRLFAHRPDSATEVGMNHPPRPPRKFHPHPFAYHQEIDLEITTLTNMGQGLGRIDGWVVMVSYALPGELIRARIYRNDKNFSEADLVSVLRSSPHRVAPHCAIFGQCGGCQYQHLAYAEQLAWKQRQVEELLRHMAKVEFPVAPVIASPREYGYRSKITPHFDVTREGGVEEIGFLRTGRRKELVDVPRCEIATEAINAALTRERDAIRSRKWKRGATLLLRDVSSGTEQTVVTDAAATALTEVGGLTFEFLAGDFFQNNPFILEAFVSYAVRQARQGGARYLVDAYCGSGLFSLFGARKFERVTGIEISATAVERARSNAERNNLTNCIFVAGSAEAIFEKISSPTAETAVLIDPPRRGSDEIFLRQLFGFCPRTIVYVSCNPATQMRDLRHLLDAGYRLTAVQPFDLFPQTKHLECVITAEK